MKKKFLLSLLASAVTAGAAIAQQSPCGTDELYNKLKQQYPQIAAFEAQAKHDFELGMQKIRLGGTATAKSTAGYDDTTYYDVPIVIHVVHDYGAEYLSDDAIMDAVNHWQQTYLAENSDTVDVIQPFKKYVGNAKIRLHLATIDPNGKPTKGITHERTYLTNNAGDEAKLNQWDPSSYINIWFINKFSGDHTGAAAYAYYPSSAQYFPQYDGVIGIYSYMDYDKAIPHEIGHVLNLEHVWGNTNSPNVACGDDDVDDTPPTMGHLTTGCTPGSLYDVTCAVGYTKNGIDYPDTVNAQNIMDYTYCQKMFTIGQTQRMRIALTSSVASRSNLITSANLAKTGALAPMPDLPPVADFSVERGAITYEKLYFLALDGNAKFIFKNRSWGDTITAVKWDFSNGASTPTSTGSSSITNKFTQPGWVTVSLTATGNNTGNTTFTDSQAVYIADTTATAAGNFSNDFATAASVSNWPMFNYYKNQFQWQYYTGAGYDDNSCIRYRSYDDRAYPVNQSGTPLGDYDDIYTPAVDLTGYASGSMNLNFYTAGATRGNTTDSMQIFASIDGGVNWKLFSTLQGNNLLNNSKTSGEFVPTSQSQWKAQTIAIPSVYSTSRVYFRLRYWPGEKGNDLYIDKFGTSQFATEVKEVMTMPSAIELYPNPSQGNTTLAFNSGSGKVSYMVKDIVGRTLFVKQASYDANRVVEETLPASIFPGAGIYLVTVTIDGKNQTQKLLIQ